jgi:hypothetical protein
MANSGDAFRQYGFPVGRIDVQSPQPTAVGIWMGSEHRSLERPLAGMEEYVMDDFRTRVRAYLSGGAHYERDRAYRAGLFAALENSMFFEFSITRDHAGARVIIAGGDDKPREFSLEFQLEPGELKRKIVKSDIKCTDDGGDVVVARFDDWQTSGDYWDMTRSSAVALYNQAAGDPTD